jgi:hypothetical protein
MRDAQKVANINTQTEEEIDEHQLSVCGHQGVISISNVRKNVFVQLTITAKQILKTK